MVISHMFWTVSPVPLELLSFEAIIMLTLHLIYLSLLATSSAFRNDPASSTSCAWSPLQFPEPSCRIRHQSFSQPGISAVPNPPSMMSMTGPHACAGIFCVYSSPSFANGRGIAIITTARAAQKLGALPVFALAAATNAALNDTTISSSSSKTIKSSAPSAVEDSQDDQDRDQDPAFRVAEVPGKGLGIVATRPIARGQRISKQLLGLILESSRPRVCPKTDTDSRDMPV